MSNGTTPRVMPNVAGMTNRQAALAYARAGLYILPVQPGEKKPGGVVGDDWPAQSSTDPEVINSWWDENEDYGIALHCGKSGIVAIDVDKPGNVPVAWHQMLANAPSNRTREEDNGKGHFFFLMPPGRLLSNSLGNLPRGWGDVRGANGVVILPPSTHPGEMPGADPKDIGGRYWQKRACPIPELPAHIADKMNEATPGDYALDEIAMRRFIRKYNEGPKPRMLKGIVGRYARRMDEGESRHTTAIECLCWAMRESRAGYYSAQDAIDTVREAFIESLSEEGNERFVGEGEWPDIVRWAAAQSMQKTEQELRDMVEERDRKRQEERTADGLYRPKLGTSDDQDHAEDIIRWVSDRVVYATDSAMWLKKDSDAWVPAPKLNGRGLITIAAREMPVGIRPEHDDQSEWTEDNWDWYWRKQYRTSRTVAGYAQMVDAITSASTSQDPYAIRLGDLDQDPYVLWVPGGYVDLLDDRAQDEKIDALAVHQHCTLVKPREMATPCWNSWCHAVFPDEELMAWALQLFAVGLTGESDKIFMYLYGDHDLGKTTMPRLITDLLGSYGRGDLSNKIMSNDAEDWHIAQLHGVRMGYIDEKPSNGDAATEQLKRLTGGSDLHGAYKGKPIFNFKPTHTLVFSSNDEPNNLDDPAVLRRLRAIPFSGNKKKIQEARDKLLGDHGRTWRHEAPGVLWQLVQLARAYVRAPEVIAAQNAPQVVARATRRLVDDQDVFKEWIMEYATRLGPDAGAEEWATSKVIYDAFADWCWHNKRARNYIKGKGIGWMGTRMRDLAKTDRTLKNKTVRGTRRWNVNINYNRRKVL